MAIVFVPLNGIGLGHVSRSFALARALRESGEAPVIFSQGIYPEFMAAEIPGQTVGALYKLAPAERETATNEIAEFARLTSPAVVIEDTYPAAIRFASDVRTLLVVRPMDLQGMRDLRERETGAYHSFLVADHPESPTWPYDAEGTAEILSWPDWKIMGPVFRSPTEEGRERVRRKYILHPDQPLYVFTMGGGGSQPGIRGADSFVQAAEQIALRISERTPGARFLYIRGPLFPPDFKIPPLFETYSVENDMPSLFAEAEGIVGRPSFNTTWECLAAGAPFWPVQGATHLEPVVERLERSRDAGLIPVDFDQWLDSSWRVSLRQRAASISARFRLRSAAEIMKSCFQPGEPLPQIASAPSRKQSKSGAPRLVIRIDEVTEANDRLMRLLAICAARGLAVSLEVIPYLSRLLETEIPKDIRYEVSQHGYAHVPDQNGLGADALRRGADLLRRMFPARFRYGFSAPFDHVPASLPDAWRVAGGKYMTVIDPEPKRWPVPVFRFTSRAGGREMDRIVNDIRRDLRKRGCAGLVLDSRRAEDGRVEELLDRILDLGCEPRLVSEVVI